MARGVPRADHLPGLPASLENLAPGHDCGGAHPKMSPATGRITYLGTLVDIIWSIAQGPGIVCVLFPPFIRKRPRTVPGSSYKRTIVTIKFVTVESARCFFFELYQYMLFFFEMSVRMSRLRPGSVVRSLLI